MIYLQNQYKRNPSKKSASKILLTLLSILVLIFLLNSFSFGSSLVSNALAPLFNTGGLFYKAYDGLLRSFSDNDAILEENDLLAQKVTELETRVIDYEAIKGENSSLRAELGLRPTTLPSAARVISKPPQIPLDTLVIDKGASEGLKEGNLVLAGERILIGKVVKVSRSQATVAVSSFPGVLSYGYVDRTSEAIEIKGEGGSGMQTKVPLDFDLKLGDRIMSFGPVPYEVGIVGSIEEDKASGFKNILVSLPASISKTNLVFIEPVAAE